MASEDEVDAFRSEEMSLVQFVIPRDVCAATVEAIGELECVQFIYSNRTAQKTSFTRPFSKQIRLCDDLLRRCRFLRDRMVRLGIRIDEEATEPLQDRSLEDWQSELGTVEADLRALSGRNDLMESRYRELMEHQQLLKNMPQLLDRSPTQEPQSLQAMTSEESPLMEEGGTPSDSRTLRTVAGVIEADKVELLSRLSFRVSRGNALVRYSAPFRPSGWLRAGPAQRGGANGEDKDPEGEEEVGCVAFVIFLSGRVLHDKIHKLVATLGGRKYKLPEAGEQSRLVDEVRQVMSDAMARITYG